MESDPEAIVVEFNRRINEADLEGLAERMTTDHKFVDSAGVEIGGRKGCVEAWRGFFAAFPDYQNHFESVIVRGNRVVIRGKSSCSDPQLQGPALWTARTRAERVTEWRVYEDTAENRAAIGFSNVDAAPIK